MQTVIYGNHDEKTIGQFNTCLSTGNVVGGVLCADGHFGYSQPVGGVIVYRKLQEVLDAHAGTLDILNVLRPIGVCMAGANEFDPYKD